MQISSLCFIFLALCNDIQKVSIRNTQKNAINNATKSAPDYKRSSSGKQLSVVVVVVVVIIIVYVSLNGLGHQQKD